MRRTPKKIIQLPKVSKGEEWPKIFRYLCPFLAYQRRHKNDRPFVCAECHQKSGWYFMSDKYLLTKFFLKRKCSWGLQGSQLQRPQLRNKEHIPADRKLPWNSCEKNTSWSHTRVDRAQRIETVCLSAYGNYPIERKGVMQEETWPNNVSEK
jgi:hypothetical protein